MSVTGNTSASITHSKKGLRDILSFLPLFCVTTTFFGHKGDRESLTRSDRYQPAAPATGAWARRRRRALGNKANESGRKTMLRLGLSSGFSRALRRLIYCPPNRRTRRAMRRTRTSSRLALEHLESRELLSSYI